MAVARNLAQLLNDSFIDFLKSHQMDGPVKCGEGDFGLEMSYAATLGFVGEGFFGSGTVVLPEAWLLKHYPSSNISPDERGAAFSDWSGEIINQVIGNLKRLVSPYGVDFALSLPSVLSGKQLQLTGADHKGNHSQWWSVGGEKCLLMFTLLSDWEFDFATPDQSQGHKLKPSDIIRFDKPS